MTEKEKMLESLLEISRNMAENRKLNPLLNYAMDGALELFNAEFGYLILLEEDGSLDFRVGRNSQGEELEEPLEKISHTIFEKVITEKQPLITADAIVDPAFQESHSVQSLQIRSVLCVPMVVNEKIIGAIYIENRSKKAVFGQKEVSMLEYFAAHTAINIENTRLNEDLERRVTFRTKELLEANQKLEQEVADRKRVEDQLRKLHRAVEQSPTTVLITDKAGKIEYVNPTFTKLTGYTEQEAIGSNTNMLKSGQTPEEVYRNLWKTITSGDVWRGEFVNRKKNGELYWEQAVISPVRDSDGAVTHFVAVKEDITERKRTETELKRLATIDALTGLWNRHYFFYHAAQLFKQARRYGNQITALMIDLDHFKELNDQYGHVTGDQILQTIAKRLSRNLRDADILGRYGGEEFALILPHTSMAGALELGVRLWNVVRQNPVKAGGLGIPVTISLGAAELNLENMEKMEHLLDRADQALYAAKDAGRDRVGFWSDENAKPEMLALNYILK